jgi:hypothetical protein
MAGEQTSTTQPTASGVVFEVDRFEWVAERLELAGRWYGLRGHRFMRPLLIVDADDGPRRMLAVLDHKPWAAEDGELWVAAFPWEGEPVETSRAELAVAPSVEVELAPPAVPGRPRRRASPARSRKEKTPPVDEVAALRAQLASEQRTVRRLAAELDAANDRLGALESADAQRAELERVRDTALAERDEAQTSLEDARRAAAAEADDARARAALDHDSVRDERDAAVRARAAAQHERDEALDQRSVSDWERKAALAERDVALSERDHAVEVQRAAVAQIEKLERRLRSAEREHPTAERAHATAERAQAAAPVAEPPPPEEPAPPPAPRRRARREEHRYWQTWVQRLVALALLIVWAVVVYKVLQGVV